MFTAFIHVWLCCWKCCWDLQFDTLKICLIYCNWFPTYSNLCMQTKEGKRGKSSAFELTCVFANSANLLLRACVYWVWAIRADCVPVVPKCGRPTSDAWICIMGLHEALILNISASCRLSAPQRLLPLFKYYRNRNIYLIKQVEEKTQQNLPLFIAEFQERIWKLGLSNSVCDTRQMSQKWLSLSLFCFAVAYQWSKLSIILSYFLCYLILLLRHMSKGNILTIILDF